MTSSDSSITIDFKDSFRIYKEFQLKYEKKGIPPPYQYDKSLSTEENLSNLAARVLDDKSTSCYLNAYRPLIIEMVARLVNNDTIEREYLSLQKYQTTIPGTFSLNAFAKIMTSTNEISILVEYFLEKRQFIESLKHCINTIKQDELQLILLSFYRLITTDRQKFYKFVNPNVLYSVLTNSITSDINKYLTIKVLSSYLFLAQKVTLEMIDSNVNQDNLLGYYEGETGINYKFLSIMEAKRLSNLTKLESLESSTSGSQYTITFTQQNLSSGVSLVSGILVPNLASLNNPSINQLETKSEFVPIEKSVNALKQLAASIQKSQPVMLVGRAGSGKTFLINELAKFLHMDSNNIIKIHLNQQTDSKLLLGTYSSGATPGSFEWKRGVLTTAVKEGRWVLVEDIDKAPNEVLSILLSLLESRELTIPSRGEVIKAANGFQLISTIRTQGDSKKTIIPDLIGLRLWNTIELEDLESAELKTILNKKFPLLERFIKMFIKCFLNVKEIYNSRRFVSMNKGSQPRLISIRDLMKFCTRCNMIMINAGIKTSDDLVQDELFDALFQEAVDCFTSSVVERDPIEALVLEIGSSLEIPTSRINLHLTRHVPNFLDFNTSVSIGRSHLEKHIVAGITQTKRIATGNATSFARTNHSLRLMEKVGVGISMCEPLLLVGETGTGKTTVVQEMAKLLNKKLTVINVSQQTEVGDLLGGFKPVNAKTIALPIQDDFEELFSRSFSIKKNAQFIKLLAKCFNRSQWKNVARLWKEAYKMAKTTYQTLKEEQEDTEESSKKKRKLNETEKSQIMAEWKRMQTRVSNFEKQAVTMENSFVFKFIEGSLVKAVRNGEWLLLDEMNLASPETLDSISDLLSEEIEQRNILLSEKGDMESIKAHKDFRIFGCMNPATDVGKRDLPSGIRSRFTEIYVHSPDQDISDLLMIIDKYIGKYAITDEWVGNDIAELYLEAKKLSDTNQIVDGANQKPHFSIRTLTRTLLYVRDIVSIYGLRRSLYEGFCMSFLTLLDINSEAKLKPLIEKYTIGRLKNARSIVSQIPPNPSDPAKPDEFVQFRHYWMRHGPSVAEPQAHYIITPFVEKNMMNLVRATSGRRFPVLIQGPTSAGKTSMINHLAKITGHKFVRINNHEHTDLQEYLGTYISDDTGKLVFKEGILVEALRNGHWIVLDELNLAPTDVLEALNRLLDDNRELFIPETQEVIRPHPDFMLFATQNPPGLYGGRKVLSKAFRNRFLELHFDDIPQDELEIILRERCQIAPTYAKKIVSVYKELSVQRQSTRLFEQKNSFATLRDLFRWAQREAIGYEQLAANGYMLLAERVRRPEEKAIVKQVLETVMKVTLDMDEYYKSMEIPELLQVEGPVVWTKAMRKLAVLVTTSMQYNEPLLLVGETGCGKTTVCQLIAQFFNKELIIVNAHQNTETGDLLGAQRPVRNRSDLQAKLVDALKVALNEISVESPEKASLEEYLSIYNSNKSNESLTEETKNAVEKAKNDSNALFEWCDGPLVTSLKNGSYFLLDEISLADDSVLERLNSVLEPERSLFLAEKGTDDAFITADAGFQFLATMNPGGDYGKKELSPALRNRFTEIWVPSMEDFEDVKLIVSSKLDATVKDLSNAIVKFSEWYGLRLGGGSTTNGVISLRDILAWVSFVNSAIKNGVEPNVALLHGACMVFIDALGTNNTASLAENEAKLRQMKFEFVDKLSELQSQDLRPIYEMENSAHIESNFLSCGNFKVARAKCAPEDASFNLQAPTTASNAMRVIRAMQVHKPILLEGSPGVGKTSLISALAQATGNNLTRINLSEQTDLIDLFGSDSPVEGGEAGEFVWRDAPFLRAMERGEWVLLDEMNLASQSVLEGLNACLDHRGEAYIPELDKTFISHPEFLVFAAQNPQYQGGGRKGLPKSFVNRFTVVYVDMLTEPDLRMIAQHLYPSLDSEISNRMIKFMSQLEEEVVVKRLWGSSGGPWEFNLRDTLRWLSLLDSDTLSQKITPGDFFDLIVKQRFRTVEDRSHAERMFEEVFGERETKDSFYQLGVDYVQCKGEVIARRDFTQYFANHKLNPLQCNFEVLETMMRCINHAWPMLLVGPSNSGKTELIRFASSIVGAKIYEFSMNSDIDSMDILGGYEQADISRELAEISNEIIEFLLSLLAINLQFNNDESSILTTALNIVHFLTGSQLSADNFPQLMASFKSLQKSLKSNETAEDLVVKLNELEIKVKKSSSVKFQWFDGLLVQAVEKGHWLILDNANLCSPSVLDRLNSLLEINGALIINECTNEDGSPRYVKPHPNFRLFLTADPKYGELSRAMRNRGVEIYLEPLKTRATTTDKRLLGFEIPRNETELTDKLDDLKISEPQLGKAVTGFTDSYDSELAPLAYIIDAYELNGEEPTAELVNLLSGIMPINAVSRVRSFFENVIRSSEFTDEAADFVETLSQKLAFLNELGIVDRLLSTYQSTCGYVEDITGKKISFTTSQALLPLLNMYLLPSLQLSSPLVDSNESNFFLHIICSLSDASKYMNTLRNRAETAKVTELSYIERSAAAAFGRNIKKIPRLGIYQLVKSIFEFVKAEISQQVKEDTLWTLKGYFKSLFDICLLWNNLVSASSVQNESKLRVYQQQILKWIEKFSSSFESAHLINLINAVNAFAQQFTLTRGSAMSIIWESSRAVYASSSKGWENFELLSAVAQEFDEVCLKQFPETIETVNELKKMILILFDDCLHAGESDDFNALIEDLRSNIVKLDTISAEFLHKRHHKFRDEFNLLLNFTDASATAKKQPLKLTNELMKFTLEANRSTLSISKFSQTNLFKPYPRIFDSLWEFNGSYYASNVNALFNDELFVKLIEANLSFRNVAGGKIDESLDDIKFLSSLLISNSGSVLDSYLSCFKAILLEWIAHVTAVHEETLPKDQAEQLSDFVGSLSTESFSQESIAEYIKLITEFGLESFATIFNTFFAPALLSIRSKFDKAELGKAWVLISCGLIQLYVPNNAYDPAIADHVVYDNFVKLQQLVDEIKKSWITVRLVTSGDAKIYGESLVPVIDEGIVPKAPRVYRSGESIDALFEEWSSFIDSSIDTQHVESLIAVATEVTDKSTSQIQNFQQNASQFALRLRESYSRYADLNDVLSGYIYGMKLGLELLHTATEELEFSDVSSLWPVDLSVVSSASRIENVYTEIKEICRSAPIDYTDAENVYTYFIQLSAYQRDFKTLPSTVDDYFNQVLLALYYRWTLRRLKQEEQESIQKGVFVFSDPTLDAEKDFQRMFPDSENIIDAAASDDFKTSYNVDDVYFEVSKAYVNVFNNKRSDLLLTDLVNKGSDILSSLAKLSQNPGNGANSAPVLSSIISELNKTVHKFTDSAESKDLDFYSGYSPYETRRAGLIISRLQGSVHGLLKQWPEHATLQQLFRICGEFLEYSSSTPVYRLLTKVEQVYTFIGEWEKYAHSGVSLKAHFETVSGLIVSWRKLELVSWRQVFVNEEKAIERKMGKWWFHLFESIILPATQGEFYGGENEVRVVAAINVFLSQTSYGEYKHRLNLLTAFIEHVHVLAPESPIYDSLLNVVSFYSQFTSIIEDAISAGKKKLEKDVKEVILLASWKDINIDALKQSSRRSHHNLYKIIRKYRDLLSTSITSLIETGLGSSVKSTIPKSDLQLVPVGVYCNTEAVYELCSQISTWNQRPARLRKMEIVHKNMSIYVKRLFEDELPNIYGYAKDIVEDVDRLRRETPKQLTEENKSLCASLKTQKRKVFSDSLRELRRMGLKLHTTSDIQKMLSSVTAILANSKSLSNSSVAGIDAYFFRLLDLLPRLRASVSALNEEVPPAEALKALAAAENLIFTSIAGRQTLVKITDLESSLGRFIKTFEAIGAEDFTSESAPTILKASMVEFAQTTSIMAQTLISWLPKVIDFALFTVQSSSDFTKLSYDTIFLVEAKTYLAGLVVPQTEIYTERELEISSMLSTFLATFTAKLNAWKSNNSTLSFVADFILEWINSQRFDFNVYSSTSLTQIKTVDDVEVAFRELSTSIMVSIQKISKLQEDKGSITEENDNWLVDTQRRITKYTDLLFPLRMSSKLTTCVETLSLVEFDQSSSDLARAVVAHALPLVKHYQNIVTTIVMKMRENYIGTSHGTYILSSILYTIAKEGFCSPQPPSEQKESDNLQDGTGLGDGDGATNNSKDVEDDEDLSEQAQQPNEENKDKDDGDDENDDAVDIEGDMAGNLEDAPPEDDDEDGDEKEDEDEELDEEVDDIDDMDPNAIDEKMWDEEAADDSKEKDSDKMPDKSNTNDDMEAMDEDDNDQKKDDNKPQDDSTNPEDAKDEDDKENDDDGEDEEDVGQQEDEVRNDEDQQLDADVPEAEVLDLPDEINLDSDKEGSDEEDEKDGDEFEDMLDDLPEEENEDQHQKDENKDVEMTDEEVEEENKDEEDAEGESNNKDDEGDDNQEDDEENVVDDNKEINEEEGVGSDEELMDVDQKDGEDESKKEDEAGEDEKEEDIEGLNGLEDGNNDDEIDADTAVQQRAGMESEGADADVKEEQDNIGTSGGTANFQDQEEKQKEEEDKQEEQTDASRDQASESLKELGDSLKEFHRRRQEIKEATDDDMVDQQTGERPDEFQHLEGQNTENDTQALGAANKDQIQSINDDMAIDDDEEEPEVKNEEDSTVKQEDEQEAVEKNAEELQEAQKDDGDFNGQTKSAMIGERKRDLDNEDFSMKMEIDDDDNDDDDEEGLDEDGYEMVSKNDNTRPYEEAQELWKKSDEATRELTAGLCEQLRLILEPTLATKLKGDYKTGKRLNMKRIIPYIASQFRKDKIWMRRTKPSKREYQIMIAVDDSKSMAESKAVEIAFQSIALVSKALTQLESGQLSVVKFGDDTQIVHPFEKQFSSDCGVSVFQNFGFEQTRTDIKKLVNKSLGIFNDARSSGSFDLWQLQIILSDGVCEDHETIQRLVRQAREEKIMLVFVIIDGVNNNESILDMSQVNYIPDANGQMKLHVDKYLDSFPFEFYVVVHNINELPEMLALILRQYFSELASA